MESSVKEEKHEPVVVATNSHESKVKQEKENASIKSEQQDTVLKNGEEIKKEEGKDDEVKKELDPLIESFYSEVSVFFLILI
jgi:hypothetical protein